jgi:dienelactone hydrolase
MKTGGIGVAASVLAIFVGVACVGACSSDSGASAGPGGTGDPGGDAGSSGGTGADATTAADGAKTPPPGTDAQSTADGPSTNPDGAPGGAADPNLDGPFAIAEADGTQHVASTNDDVAIHVAYPTVAGTYPVVVVAHGFSLPPTQYAGYLKRLATFGYVALTVDFPGSIVSGTNNTNEAKDLLAGLDWAKADAKVGPLADVTTVGMTGHSLGGKLALLAATMDPRVKAAIELDPVDGGQGACNPPACVNVADLMPSLHIPTAFLGETTDSAGGFQPCAPAAQNFTTFYAKTNTPSLEVTVLGANHMSFLDDTASCGITCSFCKAPTAPNAQVNGMAKAYVVAFYERWLRGNTAYDTYLAGAQAQARYVTTNQVTIVSK